MTPGKGKAGSARCDHRLTAEHSSYRVPGERDSLSCQAITNCDGLTLLVVTGRGPERAGEHIVVDHDNGQDRCRQGQRVQTEAQDKQDQGTSRLGVLRLAVQRLGVITGLPRVPSCSGVPRSSSEYSRTILRHRPNSLHRSPSATLAGWNSPAGITSYTPAAVRPWRDHASAAGSSAPPG